MPSSLELPEPRTRRRAHPKQQRGTRLSKSCWLSWLALTALLLTGCRSFVNSSPNLRWWLFANFGADQLCPEMLKRGAPLKLKPNGNTINLFAEPQFTLAHSGAGQPQFQLFSGVNLQFSLR